MTTEEKAVSTVNDEAIKQLLADPAFLFRVKSELDRFIVGEDENKLLLFLIACSSHTKWNLSAIINASSSAGKSWLKNHVLAFLTMLKPIRD